MPDAFYDAVVTKLPRAGRPAGVQLVMSFVLKRRTASTVNTTP
jgi:hypothetical protein